MYIDQKIHLNFTQFGGEEYFENGICIIEWGKLIEDVLPKDYIKINFSRNYENENSRILDIQSVGNKYDELVNSLLQFTVSK